VPSSRTTAVARRSDDRWIVASRPPTEVRSGVPVEAAGFPSLSSALTRGASGVPPCVHAV